MLPNIDAVREVHFRSVTPTIGYNAYLSKIAVSIIVDVSMTGVTLLPSPDKRPGSQSSHTSRHLREKAKEQWSSGWSPRHTYFWPAILSVGQPRVQPNLQSSVDKQPPLDAFRRNRDSLLISFQQTPAENATAITDPAVGDMLPWKAFSFHGHIQNCYVRQTNIPIPGFICNFARRDAHHTMSPRY